MTGFVTFRFPGSEVSFAMEPTVTIGYSRVYLAGMHALLNAVSVSCHAVPRKAPFAITKLHVHAL